jgi:hypothetical protein
MKIRFHDRCEKAEIDIGSGLYRRTFRASEQPFEVTDDEWLVLQQIRDNWTETTGRGKEKVEVVKSGPLFALLEAAVPEAQPEPTPDIEGPQQ